MKTILITGGAGFIGSNLVEYLLNNHSYTVISVDNKVPQHQVSNSPDRLKTHVLDLNSDPILDDLIKQADAIVHLAAETSVMESVKFPRKILETNIKSTLNVLEAARKASSDLVINASTGGALVGDINGPVNEKILPSPMSPYGASKLATEGILNAYQMSYALPTLNLRFSNIYGEYSYHKTSAVAQLMKSALSGTAFRVYGDGSQIRDYFYVKDLCWVIEACIAKSLTGTYQLGSGRGRTLNELIDIVKEECGLPKLEVNYEPFRAGEVHTTWCNVEKIQGELDEYPITPLDKSIGNTWSYFKSLNFS